MAQFKLTDGQVAQFHEDGYLIIPKLFNTEEMEVMGKVAHADADLDKQALDRHDKEGNTTRISLKNTIGEDIYSAVTSCHRIVDSMEQLLGDEVYHYHHKMTMKEPFVGGAWEWHQDYGYWYNNGCLYPDMASVMVAVDRANRENGCLQALRGSHKLGRIEHGVVADQTGADLSRMDEILKRLDLVYVELEPGDACFFHANTLHRSDANNSPHPRWTLISCYNTKHNNPYKVHHHPNYSYLERWDDARVLEIGRKTLETYRREGVVSF